MPCREIRYICIIRYSAVSYTHLGISSWLFGAVTTPIFLAGIQENINLVAQGLPATNIATSETVFTAALITMGGMGATLALNVLTVSYTHLDVYKRQTYNVCIKTHKIVRIVKILYPKEENSTVIPG